MATRLLTFTFRESDGLARTLEPVRFGASLASGLLRGTPLLGIVDDTDADVPGAGVEVVTRWPDGSACWLVIEFDVSIEAGEERGYALVAREEQERPFGSVSVADGVRSTRAADEPRLELSRRGAELRLRNPGSGPGGDLTLSLQLVDRSGECRQLAVESIVPADDSTIRRHSFEVRTDAAPLSEAKLPRISVRLDLYPSAGLLEIELCVHNPAAADHPKGLWDLGDPASNLFREIGVRVEHPGGQGMRLEWEEEGARRVLDACRTLEIAQISSGGANRDGRAHVDRDGRCPPMPTGYSVRGDDRPLACGARATPSGIVEGASGTLTLHVSRFWQEFPSALRMTPRATTLVLFGAPAAGRLHELQPGERKRRRATISISPEGRSTPWLAHRLGPPILSPSRTLPDGHFQRAETLESDLDEAFASLIATPEEFFHKREVVDEYGWRNFGDVFADHENLYNDPGNPPLISHYNNQYDLVFGFGMQFLRTRDSRWFELMDDLARHVTDIDIYHTSEDRVEYNRGLFWHTNHYEDAATATHRTFSRRNYDPADPAAGSGGPGPEHCYTSGLALHYLLSGDTASKEAGLGLARWIVGYFEGDEALLGRLHSIAKGELPALVGLLRRRPVREYRYSLTRGTGNLLVALLDAHLLTAERGWLDTAEAVLLDTFHPDDDPARRDLDDIERTWSHTVFLQAVLRYIAVKDRLGERDAHREHARLGFLNYARWTLEHGVPYLDAPDRLEFVNDTWAAQDIRRCVLMCAAARHDPARADAYRTKAALFGRHVVARLESSEQRAFTRVQAIVLQNIGMATWFETSGLASPERSSSIPLPPRPRPGVSRELGSAARKMAVGLGRFDPRNELRWWRNRN